MDIGLQLIYKAFVDVVIFITLTSPLYMRLARSLPRLGTLLQISLRNYFSAYTNLIFFKIFKIKYSKRFSVSGIIEISHWKNIR
jgi:hypothetical protein